MDARAFVARARDLSRMVLDLMLPPRCHGCGVIVQTDATLCPACWSALSFVGRPQCERCGTPFEFEAATGSVCGGCLASPPVWRRARSAVRYDEASRGMILRLKHGDDTGVARLFARWMTTAGGELFAEADLLVPVPLHPARLFRRRYNQSALLAAEIARLSGVPAGLDVLRRVRRTPSQGGLDRSGRSRNVKGAFRVRRSRRAALKGRRVILVDDVLTSGATATACTKALRAAGVASVDVLTVARVV